VRRFSSVYVIDENGGVIRVSFALKQDGRDYKDVVGSVVVFEAVAGLGIFSWVSFGHGLFLRLKRLMKNRFYC